MKLPLYIELPDHGEGSCVFFTVWLDISPGTHSPGLSAMPLLGVVSIKGNTGKCRSKCEKIGTEGLLDSPCKETPSSQTSILILLAGHVRSGLSTESFHWQTKAQSVLVGKAGEFGHFGILRSTHILTSQQLVLGYKLVIPYLSE